MDKNSIGIILLVICLLPLSLNAGQIKQGLAQNEIPMFVDGKGTQVPLEKSLKKIEQKFNINILFRTHQVRAKYVSKRNTFPDNLVVTLETVLGPVNMAYEQVNTKNFIIYDRDEPIVDEVIQETVIGQVTDVQSGESLPGVNVMVKGTTAGTSSGSDGTFELTVESLQDTLVFSFVGYQTQEVPINGRTEIDVALQPQAIAGEELVVVGYGTVKKSDLTGSVETVSSEEVSAINTTNVMESLKGRSAGVQVLQNTGEPGGSISVRIRGTNSIQGNNEPLYVIDGFPVSGGLESINNLDIESIEILKDASATSIYGSRGANGVVVITTKSGRQGPTAVQLVSSYGIQTIRKKMDMMNASEYAEFYNKVAANDGWAQPFTQAEIDAFGEGFDWQDFVFRNAPIQNHSIAVNGGNESTRFSVSGSLFDERGIIKNSGYSRYSLLTNLSHKINEKFSVSSSIKLAKLIKDNQSSSGGGRGTSLISGALYSFPTVTPYNEDGSIKDLRQIYHWSPEIRNPALFIYETQSENRSNRILANADFEYRPFPDLAIRIMGGIENSNDRYDYYRTNNYHGAPSFANVSTSESVNLLNENTLSYSKTIGKHSISSVIGFTFQNFKYTSLAGSGTDFESDVQESYDLGGAAVAGIPGSSYSESSILSGLGRINYNYDDRYLVTLAYRADGSSKYSEGNKWGYFPSGAFAWRISNEDFLDDSHFITDLKLRLSWGLTGSQAIGAYATLSRLYSGRTVFGGSYHPTYAPGTTLPGDLKWETTEQTNIGLDVGLFEDRVTATVDYYYKITKDLLNPVPITPSMGFRQTIDNVGVISNKGLELGVNANLLSGTLAWDINGNISFNRNKVKKLFDGQDILGSRFNVTLADDYINILREGEPLGIFYGYLESGYDEEGLIQYEDLNEDGEINQEDKTIIGNPNPDFIYGLSSTLSFKNVEFSIFIQGVQGRDIFNLAGLNNTLDVDFGGNMPKDVYKNHWTPDNQDAKYPSPSFRNQILYSDRQVEDGSYLRVRNIQLAYDLPIRAWGVDSIEGLQISVSGKNLITLTDYSRWDPVVNSYGGSSSINQAIDHHTYPINKSISFGVRANF